MKVAILAIVYSDIQAVFQAVHIVDISYFHSMLYKSEKNIMHGIDNMVSYDVKL